MKTILPVDLAWGLFLLNGQLISVRLRDAMDANRRVLFVVDYFYPHVGGGETLFRELAMGLVGRGWLVTVLTLRESGNACEELWNGIRVIRIATPPFAPRYWFILLSLVPALRLATNADIIHAGGYASAWAAWLAGWWGRRPKVLTVFEVFGDQWLGLRDVPTLIGRLYRAYEWLTLRLRFDRYLCISGFTRERLVRFAKVPVDRTVVVYPAVDYEFWRRENHSPRDLRGELGLPPESFVYLYFGRPGVSKGVVALVEAAVLIQREVPESCLLLILSRDPAGGYRKVMRRIAELNLENYVKVMEPVPLPELPSYLLASNCVVIPSLSEGFGYSAVEAASLGCRVVATRGHAVEEVLGGYGAYVDPRDTKGLADAIIRMAACRPQDCTMPQKYSVSAQVQGTWDVYRTILSDCQAGTRRSRTVGRSDGL